MSEFLNDFYKDLEPYVPGEQPQDKRYIKLNTNESPFPPSPKVKAVLDSETVDRLKLYPDPTVKPLRQAIAETFGLKAENVFVGNGSDDVIAFSVMAFCGKNGKLACPDISYGFYPVYAKLFGVKLKEIPLDNDFKVKPEDYFGLDSHIIIANPNAPTGLSLTAPQVESILKANPHKLVMIDEAYVDFSEDTAVELIKSYKNLMVIRTFSKSRSLAGLRVGFALADKEIIEDLEKIRYSFNPYNINALTIKAASESIKDTEYFNNCTKQIIENREFTKSALDDLGFTVLDSKANFLFASHKNHSAKDLYEKLKDKGVLVRYFSKKRIDNFLRITVGSKDEMDTFIKILKEILG